MNDRLKKDEFELKSRCYDKRLIKQIVAEIEGGLPRKSAVLKYSLGKSTLDGWMRKYGSSEYHSNKRKSYSPSFRREVVNGIKHYEMTFQEAKIHYNIDNVDVVRKWVLRSKKENVDICDTETDQMPKKQSKNQDPDVEQLKQALKQAEMKIEALNTLIDLADNHFKINIRKKPGAKQ
jgi:transposase